MVVFLSMRLKGLLSEIDGLRNELRRMEPLDRETQKKLQQKIRFEWNYNSNHMEGNTLSYSETELLLIFDRTKGDHEMREYEEMKAHDAAVKLVYEYAGDTERNLNETFIKQLNEVLLVRPFWKVAITPDGQPTRRLIDIGTYKKHPNSVRLSNGELFEYASPEETPALMGDLVRNFHARSTAGTMHPVEIGARIHYEFVRIHPFDDGNGRTARLLMNYVLIRSGYFPAVIKTSDKKSYLAALNKADVGDMDSFLVYIAEQALESMNIAIDIAKGNRVEEAFVRYGYGS